MKILYVETKATVFGGQKALIARCAELDRHGVSYSIIHPYHKSEFLSQFSASDLQGEIVKPGIGLPFVLRYTFIVYYILVFCTFRRYNIIHLDAFDSAYVCAFLKLLGVIRGTRILFTIRSERYLRFTAVDRGLLRYFDRIATNSLFSARMIAAAGDVAQDRILVTYSPIAFDLINIVAKDTSTMMRALTIGYVGSMDVRKRLDRFVHFSSHLLTNVPNVSLRMKVYGSPKTHAQREFLDHIVSDIEKSGVSAHFEFCGYADINVVASEIDVLFCPFDNEPFGRVVPEFLYAGVPVIIVDSGGLSEAGMGIASVIAGDNDEERLASFTTIIASIARDPASGQISENDRQRLVRAYSDDVVVGRELEMYRGVLSSTLKT